MRHLLDLPEETGLVCREEPLAGETLYRLRTPGLGTGFAPADWKVENLEDFNKTLHGLSCILYTTCMSVD